MGPKQVRCWLLDQGGAGWWCTDDVKGAAAKEGGEPADSVGVTTLDEDIDE